MDRLFIPYNPFLDFSKIPNGDRATFGVEVEGFCKLKSDYSWFPFDQRISSDTSASDLFFAERASTFSILAEFPATALRQGTSSYDYETWVLSEDSSIQAPDEWKGLEIKTPILSALDGFSTLQTGLAAMRRMGLETNKSCALQSNVSLGWKRWPPIMSGQKPDRQTMKEVQNIGIAFIQNKWFFDRLVSPYRQSCDYCREPLDRQLLLARSPAAFYDTLSPTSKCTALNFWSLISQGTLENRMKEADGYEHSAGYVQFFTLFACHAAQNPSVNPEQLLHAHFKPQRHACRTPLTAPVATPSLLSAHAAP